MESKFKAPIAFLLCLTVGMGRYVQHCWIAIWPTFSGHLFIKIIPVLVPSWTPANCSSVHFLSFFCLLSPGLCSAGILATDLNKLMVQNELQFRRKTNNRYIEWFMLFSINSIWNVFGQFFVSHFGKNINMRKQKAHSFVCPHTSWFQPWSNIRNCQWQRWVLMAHRQCVAEFLSPESEECFDLCSNVVADSDFAFNGPCQKPNEANAKITLSFNKLQFMPLTEWIPLWA